MTFYMSRRVHWERVYETKAADEVSWYQRSPTLSLELIRATGVSEAAWILDVGGGASSLVDHLVALGYERIGVLDVAEAALAHARDRLGPAADRVEWYVSDVTTFVPTHPWDVWHDRTVFHFLVDPADRAAYREVLVRSVPDGGHVVVATFGPRGPKRCSGLDVVRYSADALGEELGSCVRLVESRTEEHETPSHVVQQFMYARFRRVGEGA